jgi:hypothetical protein
MHALLRIANSGRTRYPRRGRWRREGLIPEDLIASELRLIGPVTRNEDPGSSRPGQPEAELLKHLIGGLDLTLVEHSHAPFRTGLGPSARSNRERVNRSCAIFTSASVAGRAEVEAGARTRIAQTLTTDSRAPRPKRPG